MLEKKLLENMKEARYIFKNKGSFLRLSIHFEKHAWIYGEVVGLIVAAIMQMLHA